MKEYLLKEIANVKNGYAFDSSKYSDKGIPIIRIADIKDNIDLSKCVCIDEEINKEFLIKKGSLLIALSGATTGKMGVFSDNKIAYLNQRICSIYTKNKDISQEFLIYFLKSIQKKIIVNSYGGAQPNISSRWIENIKIKVPNIEMQKKISKKLELLENNIKLRKSQLVFLKELTKSLFTTMFGDPLVNDKNEWKFYKIKNVGKIISGSTPSTNISKYWNGEYLWITPAELNDNSFIVNSTERKLTYLGVKNSSLIELPIGTVLLSSRAPIGKVAIVGKKMFCNQGFKNIIPNKEVNSVYLYYILKEKKEYLNFLGRGVTFKELSKEIVENISIKVPPIELQNKFAERIEKIAKLSFEIEETIKETENLYNSLMSKYFD